MMAEKAPHAYGYFDYFEVTMTRQGQVSCVSTGMTSLLHLLDSSLFLLQCLNVKQGLKVEHGLNVKQGLNVEHGLKVEHSLIVKHSLVVKHVF